MACMCIVVMECQNRGVRYNEHLVGVPYVPEKKKSTHMGVLLLLHHVGVFNHHARSWSARLARMVHMCIMVMECLFSVM